MLTNNLKSLIIESNRLINIQEHFIYNKYATFLNKNIINIFRSSLYFLRNNFKEELSFVKKEQVKTLIKFLLSYSNKYQLSLKRANYNDILLGFKISHKDEEHKYIINYFKNEMQRYDIAYKNINLRIKNIKKLYEFIRYMDKNYLSLIKVHSINHEFIINLFIFFYNEKFDIYQIAEKYFGEIIE